MLNFLFRDNEHRLEWAIFQERTKNENTLVVDIRTKSETMNGKLFDNALEIDYYGSDFEQQVSQLDPSKTYLIYCRSGGRSGAALPVFEKYGLKAYDLIGGYNGAQ